MSRISFLILPFLAAILLASCGTRTEASVPGDAGRGPIAITASASIRLAESAGSPEELIRTALAAIAANDTAALERLLITREEFDRHVYPELGIHYPVAGDTRPETRSFLWENQATSSWQGLRRALRDAGGRRMEYLGIDYTEGGQRYRTYTIYEGTRVRVRMEDGREAILHCFGSVVEMDGRYKLLTYRERG